MARYIRLAIVVSIIGLGTHAMVNADATHNVVPMDVVASR